MKRCRQRWGIGSALALAGALTVALGAGSVARADTVVLRDGTVIEGTILMEDDRLVTIDQESGGGSIIKRQVIGKDDVAALTRLTPEQRAYKQLSRYNLDPVHSFEVEYYDQVITTVLCPFVEQFPGAPEAAEVEARVAHWQAERQLVTNGRVKSQGRWLSPEESTRFRVKLAIERATELAAIGKFVQSLQQLHSIPMLTTKPDLRLQGMKVEAQVYQQWLTLLQKTRVQLSGDLKKADDRAAAVRKSLTQITEQVQALQVQADVARQGPGNVTVTGQLDKALGQRERALAEQRDAESKLSDAKQQLAPLDSLIADVDARTKLAVAAVTPPPPPVTQVVVAADAPPPVSKTGDSLLDGMVNWFQDHIMYVGTGAIVLLLLIWKMAAG